uniref:Uncharacterized protein n=1 Tax=Arundo donax TaxID=35708 RepID=A0A0A9BAU0_ARUDO
MHWWWCSWCGVINWSTCSLVGNKRGIEMILTLLKKGHYQWGSPEMFVLRYMHTCKLVLLDRAGD